MNISNLQEGMIVKNYKVLCELLREEVKDGSSKKAQMKEIERYLKYHKEGNKFIIDEIYNIPSKKEDGRVNNFIIKNINNGEYSKEMFPLVKSFVGKNKDLEFCPKGKIMKLLKLKSDNYDIAYFYPKATTKYINDKYKLEINETDVNILLGLIYENAQEKIHNAFLNLEKLGFIYEYTNKLITIYNSVKYAFIPCEIDTIKMQNAILLAKKQALKEYFESVKTYKEYVEYINELEETKTEEEIESQLNIQIFLRGLNTRVKSNAMKLFKDFAVSENIENYFYAYGYIRNDDIEWGKEILDLAKEKIHLENYKRKVKEDFILDSYIEKFFDNENQIKNNRLIKKTEFKNGYKKHKMEYSKKIDFLFDLFASSKIQLNKNKIVNINNAITKLDILEGKII